MEINKIRVLLETHELEEIKCIKQISLGYNRLVYNINNKYILKVCTNANKEENMKKEIDFYKTNSEEYHPQLIAADDSKTIVPYFYLIEERIEGNNLYDSWQFLDQDKKEEILKKLIIILKKMHIESDCKKSSDEKMMNKYLNYVNDLYENNLLDVSQYKYLRSLENAIMDTFDNALYGRTHGDIHFNNILLNNNLDIFLIDFECIDNTPIDREFDSIFRMTRDPNSLIKEGQVLQNKKDFEIIKTYLSQNYPEICKRDGFEERILVYDILNSAKWYKKFPKWPVYNEVLFEKSKTLVRRRSNNAN